MYSSLELLNESSPLSKIYFFVISKVIFASLIILCINNMGILLPLVILHAFGSVLHNLAFKYIQICLDVYN